MEVATQMISTVGFPIFCVLALGFFIYKAFDKITENGKEREVKLYGILLETKDQLNKSIEINAQFVAVLNDLKNDISNIQNDILKIQNTLNIRKEKTKNADIQ